MRLRWQAVSMVAVLMLLVGGCGDDDDDEAASSTTSAAAADVAGTYKCGFPPDMRDVAELAEGAPLSKDPTVFEGALTMTQPGQPSAKGTWAVKGDAGDFDFEGSDHIPTMAKDQPADVAVFTFTVDGGRLVFGDEDYVCSRD